MGWLVEGWKGCGRMLGVCSLGGGVFIYCDFGLRGVF